MSWSYLVLGVAGIASIKAALDRGDLDEAARQGAIAGPVVVEAALASADRATQIAGVVAAPVVEDRAELLLALAAVAAGPDRRTAIPAARAAREIARGLGRGEPADDLAVDDLVQWRDAWGALARAQDRWIELRIYALETAAALDLASGGGGGNGSGGGNGDGNGGGNGNGNGNGGGGGNGNGNGNGSGNGSGSGSGNGGGNGNGNGNGGGTGTGTGGIDLAVALADPDPAFRRAAVALVPVPVPRAMRSALAAAATTDPSIEVAFGAAQVLCADLVEDPPEPILDALGEPGLARIRALVATAGVPRAAIRDLARCLAADKSPASAAALRTIKPR